MRDPIAQIQELYRDCTAQGSMRSGGASRFVVGSNVFAILVAHQPRLVKMQESQNLTGRILGVPTIIDEKLPGNVVRFEWEDIAGLRHVEIVLLGEGDV